jgi:signal recognition particle subunit SRP54
MFDSLSDKLEQTIKRLRGHGKITERNIEDAVGEVRLALLEADVNIDVVRDFTERVRAQALGSEVLASLTPEQHFIKIVNQQLTELMGGQAAKFDLSASPPVVIMLVGLNGAGKTTTAGKLALYLRSQLGRQPYLVPADVYRPAAIEQLTKLAEQIDVPVYPTEPGTDPVDIAQRARSEAANRGYDTVLIDTAGRLHIDDELMGELERMRDAVHPHQTVLVVDAMTGQDAVNVAEGFHRRLSLGGVIMTKLDGDARGGAALSVRAVTGAPILFAGTGEKLDGLEIFHPDRLAQRILGMGDMLTLIEKAEQVYDEKEALKLQKKLRRNEFTFDDFRDQLRAVQKMGQMGDLMKMLPVPGMKKMLKGMDMDAAEKELRRTEAIINSMTNQERVNATVLNGSRRKRIAAGSGTTVADVNRFLKQFQQTKKMMKQMSKFAGRGMPQGLRG